MTSLTKMRPQIPNHPGVDTTYLHYAPNPSDESETKGMVIAVAFLKQPRLLLSAPTKGPSLAAFRFLSSYPAALRNTPRRHGSSSCQPVNMFWNQAKVSPFRRVSRIFCTDAAQDLTLKKCVPCNAKDLRPMTRQSAQELLPKVEGWSMVEESETLKLQRSWKVKTFTKGLEFFHLVADVAEAEAHHPDLHLERWNNVKIDIWTHSVGGLTENDFILAAKISSLDLEGLLRKKAPTK